MTTLKVNDMHCNMCVQRIETAFAQANLKCEISLDTKTVTVEDETVSIAIEELDDLGFDALPV